MTICNFTDSYKKIDDSLLKDGRILDFTDLTECTGYCSDAAAGIIRERIREKDVCGIRYIDDGNHHYLSKFWMEKIEEPFDLCVFDHHTDLQTPGLLPYLSCGSWVWASLSDLEHLNDVYLIGIPAAEAIPEDLPKDRIFVIHEEEANTGRLAIPKGSRPLYISVDLDVLSPEEFTSIWDQGSMKKERLREWIRSIKTCRRVLAEDYCG